MRGQDLIMGSEAQKEASKKLHGEGTHKCFRDTWTDTVTYRPTGRTNKIWCRFYNQGFYKVDPGCLYDNPDMDCETHLRVKFYWD